MKKLWNVPEMDVQNFMPNEYCSNCNMTIIDGVSKYIFVCDGPAVPAGGIIYPDPVTGEMKANVDVGFVPCEATHYITKEEEDTLTTVFKTAYLDCNPQNNRIDEGEEFVYWYGLNPKGEMSGHCSKSLTLEMLEKEVEHS